MTHGTDVESKLFRGLGDPARLRLLMGLREGPRPAGWLADAAGLSPSNASNHLRCLLECGLVRVELVGRHNVYRLSDGRVERLLDASADLLDVVGDLIDACESYGPPARRRARRAAGDRPDTRARGRGETSARSRSAAASVTG